MAKYNPDLEPFIVMWDYGFGYHAPSSTTKTFAQIEDAIAAYNGPRPAKTCCQVWLRNWHLDEAFTDLRATCLARRRFDFARKVWVRYESRLPVA